MSNCSTCSIQLDNPDDPTTEDLGGDCLYCMFEAGDPDATISLVNIQQKQLREFKRKLIEAGLL